MELIEVEITSQAITAKYGTLMAGDILRTDAAFAKHLVEDCSAAKYSGAAPAKQEASSEAPVALASPPAPRNNPRRRPRAGSPHRILKDAE